MKRRTRQASLAMVALVVVLSVVPHSVSASHCTPTDVAMPGMTVGVDEQCQVLRPDLREEIDLSAFASYRISATIDLEAAALRGEQRVTLPNPADRPLDRVVFRLLPNANTIYGGGSLTIEGVTRGEDPASWSLWPGGTVLTVSLDPALQPGESVAIGLDFTADIPRNGSGYNIYHHSSHVTSLAAWYPVLAPFEGGWQVSDVPAVGDANHFSIGLYDVTLTAPATHLVVSTGTTLEMREEGETRVWHLVSGPARGFAIALSDRFEWHQTEREGVTINYYALPSRGGRDPQASLRIAADAFSVYNRRFGPYPYTEFDVVETFVSVGGYEFAGMVFIEQSLRAQGSTSQLRFIVAHEVAHQWWYALVGSDPVAEPWLDEALATYSVALYLEDTYGEAARRNMVEYFRREGGVPSGDEPGIVVSALST